MNIKNKNLSSVRTALRPSGLAAAIALALVASAPAQAFEFSNGELTGTLDTTVSYGISLRAEDRDDDLIGMSNLNPLIGQLPNAQQREAPGRWSVNSDDGNLNYDQWDAFSNAVKVTSELSLEWRNFGAFMRGTAFYDFTNTGKVDDGELGDDAEEKVAEDIELLDAFLYWNFTAGDREGNLRLGRQVVSWGESTFIQGGINIINPVDVGRLRTAGAELKEAFLPIDMAYGSIGLTENLSMEALYMFEFEQVEADPHRTYFSTNDFAVGDASYVMLGFGTAPQPVFDGSRFFDVCYGGGASDNEIINQVAALRAVGCGAAVPRAPTRFADDDGQYGVALRYFASELNDTEFGLYYVKYHSRLPLISGIAITTTAPSSGRYFVEYPEDIDLFGLSFNTTLGQTGIALQGEISYRDNMPLQFDDVELLFAALSPLNALIADPGSRFQSQLGTYEAGEYIQGYERPEVSQFQMTATKVIGNVMGADQLVLLGEVGATKVWDFPGQDVLRYQGDGTDTGGGSDLNGGSLRNPITQFDGFPTSFSWGYRLVARADYSNTFGGSINLSPRVAYNHDVNGISPGPGGNFIKDRQSITLGVEGTYLNRWAADISYTSFFGAGDLNLINDRDFLSLTVKYSF